MRESPNPETSDSEQMWEQLQEVLPEAFPTFARRFRDSDFLAPESSGALRARLAPCGAEDKAEVPQLEVELDSSSVRYFRAAFVLEERSF